MRSLIKLSLWVCWLSWLAYFTRATAKTYPKVRRYIIAYHQECLDTYNLTQIQHGIEAACRDRLVTLIDNIGTIRCSTDSSLMISKLPAVKYVERNVDIKASEEAFCYDIDSRDSWGLDRIDQRSAIALYSGSGRKYTFGEADNGKDVTVYIVDSGISTDPNLEYQFGDRVSSLYTYDGRRADDSGHGTRIAAVIGSNTYGVSRLANLVSVKVLHDTGIGNVADAIAGIDAIRQHYLALPEPRKAVVNLSIHSRGTSQALDDAVRSLTAAGLIVVAAAGNDRGDACHVIPAHLPTPGVITVGAIDTFDRVWSTSNTGTCVDIYAPGVQITTMDKYGEKVHVSGTSFAAAHVTGVIARYLSAQIARRTPTEVWQAIDDSATSYRINFTDPTGRQRLQSSNKIVYIDCCEYNPCKVPAGESDTWCSWFGGDHCAGQMHTTDILLVMSMLTVARTV